MEYWWNDSRNPATNHVDEQEPYLKALDWDIDELHLAYDDYYGNHTEESIDLSKVIDFSEDFDEIEVIEWTETFRCTIRVYLSNGKSKDYFVNDLYELL